MKIIISLFVAFLLYKCFFSPGGPGATYDVYYWRDVNAGNPADETYIGTTKSAASCEALAMEHAQLIHETWDYRSYVCVKKVNGHTIKLRNGEPE